MASFFLAPDPIQSTFFIPGGAVPGNGAQLFIYVAGSVSTKTTVYKDNAGNTAWSNPIVLDSGGNLPNGGVVWIPSGVSIKAVWAPSNDADPPNSPYRTIDNISGVNDTSALSLSEWVSGPTPTFVGATQFTLVGDQTQTFTVGRRLKFTVTAGTVYGRTVTSTFGVLTTITMVMDGAQSLDAGLSAVSYALLAANVKSGPERITSTSGQDSYTAIMGISRYVLGDEYKVNFTSTNTSSSPVFNSDSLGNRTLVRPDGSVLKPGDLKGEQTLRINSVSTAAVLNPLFTPTIIRSYLAGVQLSTAAVGSSNTFSTSAGGAADASNSVMMGLSSATWKTTSTWAVGNGNGGLIDAGAISSNIFYHVHLMRRPDTQVDDLGLSSTAINPALPASYVYSRRLGSLKTNATSTFIASIQDGDFFQWNAPTLDVNVNSASTVAVTRNLNVPTGVNVDALLLVEVVSDASNDAVYVSDLSTADVPASISAGTISVGAINSTVNNDAFGQIKVRTNTSGQIRTRNLLGTDANDLLRIVTIGWYDTRGKNL